MFSYYGEFDVLMLFFTFVCAGAADIELVRVIMLPLPVVGNDVAIFSWCLAGKEKMARVMKEK